MRSSENPGQTQNFVIFNGFTSSMTLHLQLRDNTYPKEETGRGGLTGTALPYIWTSKTKELMELSQTPLPEGCLSLNRMNGRCSGTESHADEKKWGTKQCKGWSQLLSGVSNSFRLLVEATSWCEALGMAEFWQGLLNWTQRIQVSVAAGGGSGLGGSCRSAQEQALVTSLPGLRDNNCWSM